MAIVRNILGVIAGYAVFVVSALLLFKLSGVDPHADPSHRFVLLTIIYGAMFSFIGGWLAQLISGSRKLTAGYSLMIVMAGFATFSLFKTSGNHYSQIAAIFLFAPVSLIGAFVRSRRGKK